MSAKESYTRAYHFLRKSLCPYISHADNRAARNWLLGLHDESPTCVRMACMSYQDRHVQVRLWRNDALFDYWLQMQHVWHSRRIRTAFAERSTPADVARYEAIQDPIDWDCGDDDEENAGR